MTQQPRILLLHPPYGDFTEPYHSLSYVAAAAAACGVECDILDLNALWFRSVFRDETVARFADDIASELAAMECRADLDLAGQRRLADLLRGAAICEFVLPELAIEILTGERFYDAADYARARHEVRAFEALLSILYPPFDFFTSFTVPPHEASAGLLAERVRSSTRLRADLAGLLREHLQHADYRFVGVTMPFSANLMPGFCLFDAVADVLPGTPRIAGGTAVTDLVKYRMNDAVLAPLAAFCDGLFVGEAELGFSALLDWIDQGGTPPDQLVQPGGPVRIFQSARRYVAMRPADSASGRYEPFDWSAFPPRYDWVDWDLYLSPERRVNYAPVRGCFWNKCSFCDYGLNDKLPTAPSRHMDAAMAVDTLARLAATGVRRFYLASDALPPSFLRKFAQEIIDRKLEIGWTCQLFITRQFDDELIGLLQRSGLSQASFGLESGSERVLEAMGKGAGRVSSVLRPAFEAFRRSSVALQPLFFFGFPGETDADRQATIDLLLEYRDLFAPITRGGQFGLLLGSVIARTPERFGVSNIRRPAGDEIGGTLDYDSADGGSHGEDCLRFQPFNAQLPYCDEHERPWAGGVDTTHTQLFLERFGRSAFEPLARHFASAGVPRLPLRIRSAFDIEEVLENVMIDRMATCLPVDRLPAEAAAMMRELGGPVRRGPVSGYTIAIRPFSEALS